MDKDVGPETDPPQEEGLKEVAGNVARRATWQKIAPVKTPTTMVMAVGRDTTRKEDVDPAATIDHSKMRTPT